MTRIKKNENVSAVNEDKRKGGNRNLDLKEMPRVSPNKGNGEPRLLKTGQTLKKGKGKGKGIDDTHIVTQIKSVRKQARRISSNLFSCTPKRTIADRDFVKKKTSDDTRELVLPSDSNIIKGNV
jgi:hypothetical protein